MNEYRYCMVMVSVSSEEEAATISTALVGQQLAACVQVMPIQSTYMWQGKIECEPERLLLIKTRSDRFKALEAAIASLHSYDIPEIIAVDITDGSLPYLNWIDSVLN